MSATTKAAPAQKKDKSHQISRSPEARKARRIIRQSLRYSIMATADDPEVSDEDRAHYAERVEEMQEAVDEALEYMASIRRVPKAKKEKSDDAAPAKAKKARKPKRQPEPELELDDDSDDEE